MVLVMALLSSCTTRDIEQEANEQLITTMREIANRPDDATLVNVHTVYKSDSLCIIQFKFNGKNALGMELSIPMEYIYMDCSINDKSSTYETTTQLKPILPIEYTMEDEEREVSKKLAKDGYDYEYMVQHSVKDIKEKYRDRLMSDGPYTEKDPDLEDRLMYSAALLRFHANCREVPKTKGKDVIL